MPGYRKELLTEYSMYILSVIAIAGATLAGVFVTVILSLENQEWPVPWHIGLYIATMGILYFGGASLYVTTVASRNWIRYTVHKNEVYKKYRRRK